MTKLKEYKVIIILIVIIILGVLYLYKIRPIMIKQSCFKTAQEETLKRESNTRAKSFFDDAYKLCLLRKAL